MDFVKNLIDKQFDKLLLVLLLILIVIYPYSPNPWAQKAFDNFSGALLILLNIARVYRKKDDPPAP